MSPYAITSILARIGIVIAACVLALSVPLGYVVMIVAVGIVGFGYPEMVLAGVLFDALHVAHGTPWGQFPIAALSLLFLTVRLLAQRFLVRLPPPSTYV